MIRLATPGNREPAVSDGGTANLVVLSSMATRRLMEELATPGVVAGLPRVAVRSMGGVVVAERVRAGMQGDIVVLASNAIEQLCNEHVAHQPVPLFVSEVVVGMPTQGPTPDVASVDALCSSLLAARAIGYSTGPSGQAFLELLQEWGLSEVLADRLVQSPPGTPVAELIADSRVTIGVQQRSEFEGADGIIVVPLPEQAKIRTIFNGAIVTSSTRSQLAEDVLARIGDRALKSVFERHGMSPMEVRGA